MSGKSESKTKDEIVEIIEIWNSLTWKNMMDYLKSEEYLKSFNDSDDVPNQQ